MNSKERLERLFSGQEIDRVPIWMLFPCNPTTFAVDVKNIPSYSPVLPSMDNMRIFFANSLFTRLIIAIVVFIMVPVYIIGTAIYNKILRFYSFSYKYMI